MQMFVVIMAFTILVQSTYYLTNLGRVSSQTRSASLEASLDEEGMMNFAAEFRRAFDLGGLPGACPSGTTTITISGSATRLCIPQDLICTTSNAKSRCVISTSSLISEYLELPSSITVGFGLPEATAQTSLNLIQPVPPPRAAVAATLAIPDCAVTPGHALCVSCASANWKCVTVPMCREHRNPCPAGLLQLQSVAFFTPP